jgi:hypothetical protein
VLSRGADDLIDYIDRLGVPTTSNDGTDKEHHMGTYVLIGRARASAVFYDPFTMEYVPQDGAAFTLRFNTTTYEGGFTVPAPRDFRVEARGPAKDLQQAHELFGNAALEMSNIIALAVNASMGLLEPELVFDVTPETKEHEFLQIWIPDVPPTVIPGRRVDVEVVEALVKAIGVHQERQRLLRATIQYVEALRSWRPGHQINCLAHLYMGVEALTKAVLREHLRKTSKSPDQLLAEWQLELKQLDTEVRRRVIFQGDEDCFATAREVSDGLEHGFTDFSEMRKPAEQVIVKTAEYLRRAIIDLAGIDRSFAERALGPKYKTPRGPLNIVRYIRGTLSGKPEQLAATDQLYPMFEWRTGLKDVVIGDNGLYGFVPDEALTAKIGKHARFHSMAFQAWDGSTIKPMPQPARIEDTSRS